VRKYLLDSNALIDAYDKLYPIGVFGGVWKWIVDCHKFYITKQVYHELVAYEGGLKEWLKHILINPYYLMNMLQFKNTQ
jgi:rRNA-processing protein FCF1